MTILISARVRVLVSAEVLKQLLVEMRAKCRVSTPRGLHFSSTIKTGFFLQSETEAKILISLDTLR